MIDPVVSVRFIPIPEIVITPANPLGQSRWILPSEIDQIMIITQLRDKEIFKQEGIR